MATPESLKAKYNIDVRVKSEVIKINPQTKCITVRNLLTNQTYEETYDDLVISTGSIPIKPNISGINTPGVFVLRDMDDMDSIINWISINKPKTASVIGGGFIGVEVVEQLHRIGINVTLIEGSNQLLAPLDPEMALFIHSEIKSKGVKLIFSDPISEIKSNASGNLESVTTKSGLNISSDLVIMGVGVKPNVELAKQAGIKIGESGAISVDEFLRTNLDNIWALGDAIEVPHFILKNKMTIPLAGPANRQGRIIADNIINGATVKFTGGLGTAIARAFDLVAASTGANEKQLSKTNKKYQSVFIHPNSHAGYYPGASPIAMKLIFDSDNKTILGAQAVGVDGIDKRIDVIATAIKGNLTIDDLIDLELAYAPPFGSAKDAVNIAGMAAQNVTNNLVNVEHPGKFDASNFNGLILDVRDEDEIAKGMLPNARHIPLSQLRNRLNELDNSKPIVVYCQSGMRSYLASRILQQNGFNCSNLTGAYKSWSIANK
jgi:NADPH-dependent 2,4-dienoyl-CoA reductase/sulfur reductase-like enzyme/rhodanese-related sulfurtransferase